MKLNLREIIEIPGGSVPFAQELDTALLDFPPGTLLLLHP